MEYVLFALVGVGIGIAFASYWLTQRTIKQLDDISSVVGSMEITLIRTKQRVDLIEEKDA